MSAEFDKLRRNMVEEQLRERGIEDERVLKAMAKVPRHLFVPPKLRGQAYEDKPLAIGNGQAISQPYVVAFMTELLNVRSHHYVLEIGTGSGYQAAVLAELAEKVVTIECQPELAKRARSLLVDLNYANCTVLEGDGSAGCPDLAPFEGIIVTAGAPRVPKALTDQLALDGTLVCPVGSEKSQVMYRVVRTADGLRKQKHIRCVFVPLVGEQGWKLDEANER